MRFETAVDLQARVFREVFDFEEVAAAAGLGVTPGVFVERSVLDAAGGPPRRLGRQVVAQMAARDVALGVVHEGSPEKSSLAVLIQSEEAGVADLVARILDMAPGEVTVTHIGRQTAFWTQKRNDPIRLGCSSSPTTVGYSGTIGCYCLDTRTGKVGILSNNHVLADVNRVPLNTPVMQPGAGDAGQAAGDVIAELTRFVQIEFGGIPNAVDAALATLTDHGRAEDRGTLYDSADTPLPIVTLNGANPGAAMPGMTVMKTGRTTRHTRGRILAVNVNNYQVDMGVGLARFDNQITIQADTDSTTPFSRRGDSGSLIVDVDGRPIALLFAGSESGGSGNLGVTGANPISSVMTQLEVALV